MSIPIYVINDINKIRKIFGDNIVHCGVFGSILCGEESQARDIDILFVYKDTTFEEICRRFKGIQLSFPHVLTYRNYGGKIPLPPRNGKYYDLVFMPQKKPDRTFMTVIDGSIAYLTKPYDAWRKRPESVELYANVE